jgi:uncharacterized protein HemX
MDPQNPIQNTTPSMGGESKSVGPAIGIVVIILIVVLGGLYFWGQRMNTQTTEGTNTQTMSEPDQALTQMNTQSTSDDTAAIEADLNATNVNDLGNEVNDINAEANASGSVQPE